MSKLKKYRPQIMIGAIAFVCMFLMYTSWLGREDKSDLESLYAGWAFVGLIATVVLQGIELHFQRMELADTRVVLARSAKAQEDAEDALNRQINAMNQGTLINGYMALLEYYDRTGGRQSSSPEVDQAKHVRQRIKHVIDNVEAEQGWSQTFGPRPVEWNRI